MKTKDYKKQVSIWTFLHKYGILVLIFLCIPLVLSVCCYFSVPYFNQAGSAAWLGFWGGYLGSTIMACVTLYVLNQQLKQNHKENKKNRTNQNNLVLFQVEISNLNSFKESSLVLCDACNYNRFVQICNTFIQESKSPLDLIKIGFSDVVKANRLFLMNFMPSASKMNELIDLVEAISDYYNSKLQDLEIVTSYLNQSKERIKNNITTDNLASKELVTIIKKNIKQLDELDSQKWLDKILNEYLDEINPKFMEPLWELISVVYLSEKARIAKILVEDGTKQTK